jgi:diguanylate cyclase (GGDEF)-like protein
MIAISKVCNTAGQDCTNGYIVMVKKLTDHYFSRLNQSTGLELGYRVLEQGESAAEREGSSYLEYIDIASAQRWRIEVRHSVHPPSFVSANEGIALTLLAFFMFGFNYYMAQAITGPINRANALLTEAEKGETELDESSFNSLELRAFTRNITRVIAELETQRRLLQKESNQDPLTQLANRRKLENFLLDKLDDNQQVVSLFLIDVDHFKLLNDNYGHSRGDTVLKQLAHAFSTLELEGESLVARYGGEEFCIVTVTEHEINLRLQAMRLVTAIRELKLEHSFSPTADIVTVSVGGVQMKASGQEDYRRLINHADKSLYLAKQNGRNRSCAETIVPKRKSVRLS